MQKLIAIAKLACLAALAAFLVMGAIAAGELRVLLVKTQQDVHQLSGEAGATLVSLAAAGNQINLLAGEARIATRQVNAAADQQAAYWNKTSAEMYKTMASLRLVIVRTDKTLNDRLAPRLEATIADADQFTRDASTQMSKTAAETQGAIDNLARAAGAAADTMADPRIRETLGHVDDTSAQLAAATSQLNVTAQHIAETTGLIETRVQQVTRPATFAMRAAKALLGLTVQAAQIAAGFFK